MTTLNRNDIGQYVCPLPLVEWDWDDGESPDAKFVPLRDLATCNAPLYVVATLAGGLYDEPIDVHSEAGWADATCWKVECENGHTLAVSTWNGTGGDCAEPVSAKTLGFQLGDPGAQEHRA